MTNLTQVRGRSAYRLAALLCALAAWLFPCAGGASTSAPDPVRAHDAASRSTSTNAPRTRRALPARIARAAAAKTAPVATPAMTPPGRAGMVIEVDPLPGEAATVTPDPIQALASDRDPALSRSTDGLEVITFPDGSQRVNLQGRFRAYSVATIGVDGRVRTACTDDPVTALGLARAATTSSSTPTARVPRLPVGPQEE